MFYLNLFNVFLYVCVLLAVGYISYFWLKKRQLNSEFSGPPAHPLFGNELDFLFRKEDIFYILTNYVKKYGSRYQLRLRGESFFVLSNAEDAEEILGSSKYVEKGATFRSSFGRILGDGTFSGEANIWKKNRKILQFPFRPNFFREYTDVINTEMDQLMVTLRKLAETGKPFDAVECVTVATFNILCRSMFQTDTIPLEKYKEYRKSSVGYMGDCFRRLFLPKVVTFFKDILHKKTLKYYKENVSVLYYKLHAEDKLKNREDSSEYDVKTYRALISCMLDDSFPDKSLKENIITYTLGGTDSAGVTVSLVLFFLAIHQDIQDKVYEELCNVLGTKNRHVTAEDLKNMTYLDQVLKETLRVHPLNCFLFRYVSETTKLGDCTIPGGANVIINAYGIQHDARYFSEPEEFRPERFTPERLAEIPKGAYMPFSIGPRNCIGKAFAVNEVLVMCSRILHKYHIKTNVKRLEDIKFFCRFSLVSVDGYKISISERK